MLSQRQILSLSVLAAVTMTSAFGPSRIFLDSFASASSSSRRRHSSSSPPSSTQTWYYCNRSLNTTSRRRRSSNIIDTGGTYSSTRSKLSFSIDPQSTITLYSLNDNLIGESTSSHQLQLLSLWVIAFASSHIGMSAIRSSIISFLGNGAQALKLINNEEWILPPWWPGDSSGGNNIFPDALTTGRQIYRMMYTVVSFVTLGFAFGSYLDAASIQHPTEAIAGTQLYTTCLFAAALSYGAVTASLFNASPLGLMPGFEAMSSQNNNDGEEDNTNTGNNFIANIRRDDSLKFTTRGLTRITRHPLILPVVPWGLANAILAGARSCDFILFGGLAIYAVAGCFAQDLRILREEGSVGTVFRIESRSDNEDGQDEREQLRSFFEATSFIPFQAVVDGRQRFDDIVLEVPWLQFVAGTVAGVFIEERFLQLLREWTGAAS
jgi:uncharacterized membrane protein